MAQMHEQRRAVVLCRYFAVAVMLVPDITAEVLCSAAQVPSGFNTVASRLLCRTGVYDLKECEI